MKREKLNLTSTKQVLSRDELRKITAGEHPLCGSPCMPSSSGPYAGCSYPCTCSEIGAGTYICSNP